MVVANLPNPPSFPPLLLLLLLLLLLQRARAEMLRSEPEVFSDMSSPPPLSFPPAGLPLLLLSFPLSLLLLPLLLLLLLLLLPRVMIGGSVWTGAAFFIRLPLVWEKEEEAMEKGVEEDKGMEEEEVEAENEVEEGEKETVRRLWLYST